MLVLMIVIVCEMYSSTVVVVIVLFIHDMFPISITGESSIWKKDYKRALVKGNPIREGKRDGEKESMTLSQILIAGSCKHVR
jgi:hypothetical protein